MGVVSRDDCCEWLRNCREGRNCIFKGCFYTHPEGRVIDESGGAEKEASLEVEIPDAKKTLEGKSFRLKKQSKLELERQRVEVVHAEAEETYLAEEAAMQAKKRASGKN